MINKDRENREKELDKLMDKEIEAQQKKIDAEIKKEGDTKLKEKAAKEKRLQKYWEDLYKKRMKEMEKRQDEELFKFKKTNLSLALADVSRINVGPNSKVGTGAKRKEKVMKTFGGMLGGALGGLGGKREDDLDSDDEPELAEDPIPQKSKEVFTDPASGTKLAVGAKMTPKGLLISSSILDSPGSGTFQTVYLVDSEGNRAGPILYDIYELWHEWTLTVSWTFDRYVDGRHVEHKEGGWSESGSMLAGVFVVPHENDGIWKQMGFSNAVAGVKSLGTLFPVTPEMMKEKIYHLVIHITRPKLDPVTTAPFVFRLPETLPDSDLGPTSVKIGPKLEF